MIVKVSQTESNLKQTYDVKTENGYYHGETGRVSRLQTITLSNQETTVKGVFSLSKWVNYIPFRWLFGRANLTRVFHLYREERPYGNIVFSKQGFYKSYYVITLDGGEVFHCYARSKGSFDYVSIYQGDRQIGLVETYLNTSNYKYTHKLYLLEEFDPLAETFSLFVLYYASYNFAQRFHMSAGSHYEKSWSISRYNHKYDETWRETHFPNENFWGKINLFR